MVGSERYRLTWKDVPSPRSWVIPPSGSGGDVGMVGVGTNVRTLEERHFETSCKSGVIGLLGLVREALGKLEREIAFL
tara:strand:- start:1170 stop:1403 length:234 start_codon:yes stop_codon:yes gene_type:complete